MSKLPSAGHKSLVHLINRLSLATSLAEGSTTLRRVNLNLRYYFNQSQQQSTLTPIQILSIANARNCSGSSRSSNNGSGNWRGGVLLRTKGQQQDIGESTILVQEGIDIQEVPVAVLKSNDVGPEMDKDMSEFSSGISAYRTPAKLDPREEKAFIEGFNRFNSPREILQILNTIPASEVTPLVALCIIRKLFELENNFSFRNNGQSWLISSISEENSNLESFGRMAIVSRLIDTIISSENNQILLDTLNVLGYESDNSTAMRYYFQTNEEFLNYRLKLCNEALIRTIEGKLSLNDICRAICSIGQIGKSDMLKKKSTTAKEMRAKFIDKMWVGIMERSNEINAENIATVFNTILHLRKSRRLVMNIVENKIISFWWNLKLSQIAEICETISVERKLTNLQDTLDDPWSISSRVLLAFSRNLSLNLHQVTEDQLCQILKAFYVLNFCDPTTEKTLNRYMKAKCLKIGDPMVVSLIMDYVTKFRLRSTNILEGVSEYLIAHDNLTPTQLKSMLVPFGYLVFKPPNAVKFWQNVERQLSEKFIQFSARDMIEVLLSCVYLQKYPLNFVKQIFSPYFLDRIHSSEYDFNVLQHTRSRLKLLDSALTLECGPKYSGPLLPRDFSAKPFPTDGRILRIIPNLENSFKSLFSKSSYIAETCIKLPNMPFNELYMVDLFVNHVPLLSVAEQQQDILEEANMKKPTDILRNRFNPRMSGGSSVSAKLVNRNSPPELQTSFDTQELIAILIQLPEHYCSDGKQLIGPQLMRIRHLKLLGCTVVSLNFETLCELKAQPQAFLEHIQENLSNAKVVKT